MRLLHLALLIVMLSALLQVFASDVCAEEVAGVLHGYVEQLVDEEVVPVASAQVSVYDDQTLVHEETTGKNGSFSFVLEPGKYTITVEKTRSISQTAFMVITPGASVWIYFRLETAGPLYQVVVVVEGLPESVFPEMRVDGSFFGNVVNGTLLSFREGTPHIVELGEVTLDHVRYVLENPDRLVSEAGTVTFQYLRQFYVDSYTHRWVIGWYAEGKTIHLEARNVIDLGNATRLVFQGWSRDGVLVKLNPLDLRVNASFQVDADYQRQYYLAVSFERGDVGGEGWYDEGTRARVSVREIEIGAHPFKYRFKGWKGDVESPNATAVVLIDGPKTVYAEWERVEAVKVEKLDPMYKAIVTISFLIFAATVLSSVFKRVKLPEVLGELFAGIVIGPYALGGLKILGEISLELNEYVLIFAEVGAILLLFIAGLEVSFGQFRAVGAKSAAVGVSGVVASLLLGICVMQWLGLSWKVGLVMAATLTATSITITMRILENMNKLDSAEGGIIINAAVIDDVLGIVVLAIVASFITSGTTPLLFDIVWILIRTIAFWLLLLAVVLAVAPRVVGVAERWRSRGTVEVVSTAVCFGSAVTAALVGLSPLIGAFAAGMALAESRVIARLRDYIDKLGILFAPIFFAVIGARFNIRALNAEGLWVIVALVIVTIVSKLVGCGIPAAIAMRSPRRGLKVGVGMMSRGEIGLIIAGIGVTSGMLNQSLYGAVVTMVIVTTVITPIALKWVYASEVPITSKEEGAGQHIS